MGRVRRGRRLPSALFVGLTALAALVAFIPAANAHAALLSSDPAHDEAVRTAPTEIRLHFNQSVSATYAAVAVVDAAGTQVSDGAPQAVGETVTQPVADLAAGTYTVSYRVVSADGHPVSGGFTFVYAPVGDGSAQATPLPPPPSPTPPPVGSNVTVVVLAGVGALVVGGASLAVILLRRRRSPDPLLP